MSLINIIEGIKQKIKEKLGTASPETLKMATGRLAICNHCPSKITEMTIDFCGECGCVLKIKSLAKDSHCRLKKW